MNFNVLFNRTTLLVLGYILAFIGVNLAMKFATQSPTTTVFWRWFIGGNVVGFFCTLFLIGALKDQNPNVIYALCIGGGFIVLQMASFYIFKDPLTFWQWLGMGLIGLGIICLQIKATV